MKKQMRVRYSLVKRIEDKTFSDYIKTTEKVFAEKGVILKAVKLPRKMKKLFKKLGAWEYELVEPNSSYPSFEEGVVSDITPEYIGG